jgi:LPXTG-motif cell wall-anchored protein
MSLRRTLSLTVALVVAGLFWASAPAGAVENPDYTAPPPTTIVTTPTPTTTAAVKTAVAVTPVRTRLAITGSDATGTVVLGAGLVTLGAGLLVLRRRKLAAL